MLKQMWAFVAILTILTGLGATQDDQALDPQLILQRMAEREAEFQQVWQEYMYRQTIVFEIVAPGDLVRERRDMAIEVSFNDDGTREVDTVLDRGRLRSLIVTPQDIDDIVRNQPFVLTPEELPKYDIEYLGKERIDELDLHVFKVDPKKIKKPNRYFQGKIWVDDQDLQIVMTRGKIVPDYQNNHFPEFESVREQIDGEFWFPTWVLADDYIHGKHLRQLVTFENFKRYQVDTSIKYGPIVEDPDAEKKPPVKPNKPPVHRFVGVRVRAPESGSL